MKNVMSNKNFFDVLINYINKYNMNLILNNINEGKFLNLSDNDIWD